MKRRVYISGIVTSVIAFAILALTTVFTNAQNPQAQRRRTVNPEQASPAPSPTPSRSSAEPEAEVVRVETNLVNTLFTATDRDHHFITSLRPEDITIFEDDVAQPVSLFERSTDRPLSLAILVDTSESQRGVLDDEKRAAVTFVDSVIRPAKDQAAILSFTGVPQMEQPSTSDLAKLHRGIQRVRIEMSAESQRRLEAGDAPLPKALDPSGYTGIWDAMWMTIRSVLAQSPEGTRRAIVLLSDGDDTSSTIKRQDVIDLALKSDVIIYAIGVHDQNFSAGKLDTGALRKICDRTGGRAFFPKEPGGLPAVFAQIDEELRSQYLIAYSPINKNRDGSYRRIRLEVVNAELRKNKTQLFYRQGYYARKS